MTLTRCVYYRARCNGNVFFFDPDFKRVVEAAKTEAHMQARSAKGTWGRCKKPWTWAVSDLFERPYAVVEVQCVGRYFVHGNPADCFELVLPLV